MIHGHGGNIQEAAEQAGCMPSEIVDMSSNINPLGPMPGILDHLRAEMDKICRLPEVDAGQAAAAYAAWQGLDPGKVLAGAGTTGFLYILPRALGISSALVVSPTYSDYADSLSLHGIVCSRFMLSEEQGFLPDIDSLAALAGKTDAVFFCNPNNPTGIFTPVEELERLARSCPNTCFVIDESYLPFVECGGCGSVAEKGLENVIVLQSLSKMFSVPGLRVGFCIAGKKTAGRIACCLPPWGVNALAQEAVLYIAGAGDEAEAHACRTRAYLSAEREEFTKRVEGTKCIRVFPGRATFLLMRLYRNQASGLYSHLLSHRILVRRCANFTGLSDHYFRVSLKDPENNRLAAGLVREYLEDRQGL